MKKRQVLYLDLFFVTIIILLLGLTYFSYHRIGNLKQASYWVNHSTEVKLHLNETLLHVLDAETGQRGFLLTRDSTYLDQYNNGYRRANKDITKVIALTADNSIQQQNARQIQLLVKRRFEMFSEILQREDAVNRTTDMRHLLSSGKNLTDSIRNEIAKLTGGEDKLLVNRTREKEHANALTPLFVLGLSVVAIFLVTIAYIKLRHEINMRLSAQDNEATIRKLQQETRTFAAALERKVNERTNELQQKNISLENINNELLSFNYVASHDLQEPLRKIRAFASRIIDSDEQLSDTNKGYFERITNAAMRMQRLIDALISYSRANSSDEDFHPTDLNRVFEEVKSDIHEVLEEKNAVIRASELPVLNVIPQQMHQLFTNLLLNALKYSKPGDSPKIKISAEVINNVKNIKKDVYLPHARYWKITISDNGIGFEKEYEEKIFELFQRLHDKNEFEGTGIGLAICRKIMQNHDGYIFADGNPGIGANFHIYFPITY